MITGSVEREVIEYAAEKGILIEPNAIALLSSLKDYRGMIDDFLEKGELIIGEKKIKASLLRKDTKLKGVEETVIIKKSGFNAEARDLDPKLRIMEEYDITGKSYSEGKIKDFLSMFRDKFQFLSSVLRQRQGFDPRAISRVARSSKGRDVEFIGMVNRKWISKKGNLVFEVEDLDSKIIALASNSEKQLFEFAQSVILDDVIGIKGSKLSEDLVIAKEIFLPDLPNRPIKSVERDLSLMAISDLHIGSKLFIEKEFNDFISWLNGNASSGKELERIGKIKYLAVVGDNIDGVGVYPDQFDELAIKDIYKQYEKFTQLMLQVPEYIEIIICPGQHDAVRRADPQPAIPKEFVKELSARGNVHFIGSPGWVEIEGLKCLFYHGASLHDLYSSVNFLSAKEPQRAIIEMLKRRDLMPSYGMRQPYVPEKKDYMLLREEPDIYFGGDMHHTGYAQYKGCSVINCGTWQTQTDFQVALGHVPTPGIATELELKTRNIRENKFYIEGDKNVI